MSNVVLAAELLPLVVQLPAEHRFRFAGYYAAVQQGYYRQAGLAVRLRVGGSNTDVVQEVLSGRAMVGVGDATVLLRYASGAPVVALGAIFQHSPWQLAKSAELVLSGHQVVVPPAAVAVAAGLAAQQVSVVMTKDAPVDPSVALNKHAAVAVDLDGVVQLKQQKLPLQCLSMRQWGADFYGDHFFTSQAQLIQHAQTLAAFREATIRGWAFALAHPQAVISDILRVYHSDVSAEALQLEAAVVQALVDPDVFPIGHMYLARWQLMAQAYQRVGLWPSKKEVAAFVYQPLPERSIVAGWGMQFWLVLVGILLILGGYFYRLKRRLHRHVREKAQVLDQLQAREMYLRAIVETSNAAVLVADLQGVLQFANRHAGDLFATTAQALVGSNYSCLVHPVDAAESKTLFLRLMHGEVPAVSVERRYVRQDGSMFWGHLFGGRLLSSTQQLQGLVAVIADISDKKQAQEALYQLNATLEARVLEEIEKNRQKDVLLLQQTRLAAMGEMIHNIAHQWRQPLNALALVVANLEDAWAYGEFDEALLHQSAHKASLLIQNMSTTIDDFRHFFRPDKAAVSFDLAVVVSEALSLQSARLQHHGIEVVLGSSTSVALFGHQGQFSQVLLNLIGNAIDAVLGSLAVRRRIEIRWECPPQAVVLTVADEGGGIDSAILERIFEPYFSTKAQGSGIGLYMSKLIVEHNMHGRLEARNGEHGAIFSVWLPLGEAMPAL